MVEPELAVVRHCPNCGAPLELDVSGDCRWCQAHVTLADGSELGDPDPYREGPADELIEQLDLGDYDDSLPQPVPSVLAALRYAAYDPSARAFLENPALVPSVRALVGAVRDAGQRAQHAGATNDDVLSRGHAVYTPDEWWTFDLAIDYLVELGSTDGLQPEVETELSRQPERFKHWFLDKRWARAVKKDLKRTGDDGPITLRYLRSTIPHRTE